MKWRLNFIVKRKGGKNVLALLQKGYARIA
jgi:hypothetical protein